MKILQIGMGNIAGGLESFVMNYYRVLVHMDVQFDFVCMYDKIAYEDEIKKLGGKIYYIPNVKKNYQGYVKQLKRILRETKYDVVHVNMLSAANIVPLRIAGKMNIPKVIAHSHSSPVRDLSEKQWIGGTGRKLPDMPQRELPAGKWPEDGCSEIRHTRVDR